MCSRRVDATLVALLGLIVWLGPAEAADTSKLYTSSSMLVRLLPDENESALSSDYFPTLEHEAWEAVRPTHRSLNWDTAALDEAIDAIGSVDSTALLILYRGRIVVEQYLQGWNADTAATMASVSKSITAVLVGIAQEKGLLCVDDPVSAHLGEGWSGTDRDHEGHVTIRHLLGMTGGLTADAGQYLVPRRTRAVKRGLSEAT